MNLKKLKMKEYLKKIMRDKRKEINSMAKYDVEVVEKLSRVVEQEADSFEDAKELVAARYLDEDIVLNWEDLEEQYYKPYPTQNIKDNFSVHFMYNKSKKELIVSDKRGTMNYSCKNLEELEILFKDYIDNNIELADVMPKQDVRNKNKEQEER